MPCTGRRHPFDLTVKGYQTFLILARLSAFITSIGCKIKHVPAVHGPDIGTIRPHFQQMLMVQSLIRFAPIPFFGTPVLVGRIGVSAILGQSYYRIRMLFMELIKELVILFQFSQIPAVVKVIAADISHIHKRIIHVQHKGMRHCGWAGGIQCMTEIIEFSVVIHHSGVTPPEAVISLDSPQQMMEG